MRFCYIFTTSDVCEDQEWLFYNVFFWYLNDFGREIVPVLLKDAAKLFDLSIGIISRLFELYEVD